MKKPDGQSYDFEEGYQRIAITSGKMYGHRELCDSSYINNHEQIGQVHTNRTHTSLHHTFLLAFPEKRRRKSGLFILFYQVIQ